MLVQSLFSLVPCLLMFECPLSAATVAVEYKRILFIAQKYFILLLIADLFLLVLSFVVNSIEFLTQFFYISKYVHI